jgi:hypothetical protein
VRVACGARQTASASARLGAGAGVLRVAAAAALSLLLTGCEAGGPRARAEAAALRRQSETLRNLIAAVETDRAFSSHHVTLGIGQSLVKDLLQLALPVETDTAPDMHVRLETAEVAFENGESRVALHGRVSRTSTPGTFADLTVHGGLHRFEVGEHEGHVTARVALDRLEVRQAEAEGMRRELVEAVIEQLGQPSLESLAAQIPPLAIPLRFERTLELPGQSVGPFEIAPASLRFRIAVAQVVALGGRLWVQLEVTATPVATSALARKQAPR